MINNRKAYKIFKALPKLKRQQLFVSYEIERVDNFENKKWNNRNLYSLYKDAQLPFEWHKKIFKHAEKKGLICFSKFFVNSSPVHSGIAGIS